MRLVEHEPAADRQSFALPRHVIARLCSVVEIARDFWRGEQLVDPARAFKRGVDLEPDLRHEFQADALRQLAAQEALVLVEMLDRLVGALAAEREYEGRGELQVGRHAHFGHGERVLV